MLPKDRCQDKFEHTGTGSRPHRSKVEECQTRIGLYENFVYKCGFYRSLKGKVEVGMMRNAKVEVENRALSEESSVTQGI